MWTPLPLKPHSRRSAWFSSAPKRISGRMNYPARVQRLIDSLDQPMLVSSLVNIRYLTGFTGSNAFMYLTPDAGAFLTDGRYEEIAAGLVEDLPSVDLIVYRERLYDNLVELFGNALSVGLESAHMTWEAQRAIASRFDGEIEATSNVVEALRLVKDSDEIDALRRAAAAGDLAFSELPTSIWPEGSEAAFGEVLIADMKRGGGERAGWPPIVAVGANASRPHHESGSTEIESGLLLIDYGCTVDGYHSDMTRTIWLDDGPDPEAERVYRAVLESNEAGIAAIEPGRPAREVDAASREVLRAYGYEEYFLHSTGHGVGLEIHEGPSVRKGSVDVLEPGHVVTVEPGVYLAGKLGVRIEDMVLVTDSGSDVLTKSSKEILVT